MVIKGASRRNIGFWSGHLEDTKKNDRAELIEKRGLAADDLRGMMREMHGKRQPHALQKLHVYRQLQPRPKASS